MSTRLWYLRVNGQPTGPFEPRDLRRLAPDDRLRCTGDPKWHRARKIVGLFDRPANDTASPARGADTPPAAVDPLAGEFSDVAAALRHQHREQNRVRKVSCVAAPATEAAGPEPVCTAPVIGAAVISALVTYFGIAFLAARAMPHQATPPPAIHEPTVAAAATSARDAILERTDPKTAEVAKLELVRQTERASETSPAWFTFRGAVHWTNRLGAPVEADFGVIVRYDPTRSAYTPDLVTRDGRIIAAEVEICGHPRHAELEQLVHELFER